MLISISLCLFAVFNPPDNVLTRVKTPEGYIQQKGEPNSFAAWLQSLPLKPASAHTKTYKGDIARTDVETAAVVDMKRLRRHHQS